MGGKTQQRVAGNAKPSNSGRIRELLINQQSNPVNIITFSALSSKNDQGKPSNRQNVSPVRKTCDSEKESATKPAEESDSDLSNKDHTKLVVRRVGNRDLYTRVRLSDSHKSDLSSPNVKVIQALNPGVKKPPQDQSPEKSITLNPCTEVETSSHETPSYAAETQSSEPCQNSTPEMVTFDVLLERLETARVLVDANSRSNIETLRDLNQTNIVHEIELLKLFGLMIQKFIDDMSLEDWDLINNALNKWIKWISKTNFPIQESHQAELCADVFMLIHQLIVLVKEIRENSGETLSSPLIPTLLDDWTNFSSSSIFLNLISLYFKLLSLKDDNKLQSSTTVGPMIEALSHIIISVDSRVVLSHYDLLTHLSANIEFDQEFKKPKNGTFCGLDDKQSRSFMALCGLLRSNTRVNLVTSHNILGKSMTSICNGIQTSLLVQEQDVVNDSLLFPPESLMAILTSRDSMMSALLSDYHVGDISVTIEPNTDSYACTLSYLFVWDLTIRFIVEIDKELGQWMIHSMKRLGLIQRLLDNIFMLLPPLDDRDSLDFRIGSSNDYRITTKDISWSIDTFLKSPLGTTISRPVNEIELVALHLYFSVASHMPVTVRKWYNNNSNKRLCNLVNEYTVKHISRVICSLEMESVQAKCQERANKDESKNLIIKARPSAKEVYAMYVRDEFKMELTIKLPQNYPLGPVQIDGGKRVGVTDLKWRSWLLQLTTFLSHQNGPILDGVDLWRKNIDKRFEGVEKCTICFSILHSNYQLPKKKCQTCANMFHNMCLYKWFESSGNSTCPLCRNPW